MGGKSSKEVPKLTGDERYMESKDKRNIYFGPKWRKKYELDGRLDVEKLELMVKHRHEDSEEDRTVKALRRLLEEQRKEREELLKLREESTELVRRKSEDREFRKLTQEWEKDRRGLGHKCGRPKALSRLDPHNQSPGRERSQGDSEWIEEDGESGQYPMIALPNPRAGDDGALATLDVYRAWTQRDVVRAVEGVVHPKTGIEGFRRELEGLAASFKLDTGEIERAVRQLVGKDWAAVRGQWVPGHNDLVVLPWAADGPYADKIAQLCNNLREHYHRHAYFSKIHECKQGDSETISQYLERLKYVFNANGGLIEPPGAQGNDTAYHQQLKIAFLSGMRPEISRTIKKTLVG
eukprot:XP_014037561.1 PREDICTED: uncharacterized protein LOC106590914 [Salmo salar]